MLAVGSMSTDPGRPRVRGGATCNMAGDSVTSGNQDGVGVNAAYRWTVPLEAAWSAQFTAAGKTPPTYTITAVGGQTTSDMVTSIVAQIRTPAKTVLIIMASVNDVFFAVPVLTTQSNYRTLLREQLRVRPGSAIFVVSPCYLQGEKWPDGANTNDAAIRTMNAAIAAVCAEPEFAKWTTWVDIRTGMFQVAQSDNPANAANSVETQSLGTHPSLPLGQNRMSALALAAIPVDLS